jgi:hypothetical protein
MRLVAAAVLAIGSLVLSFVGAISRSAIVPSPRVIAVPNGGSEHSADRPRASLAALR